MTTNPNRYKYTQTKMQKIQIHQMLEQQMQIQQIQMSKINNKKEVKYMLGILKEIIIYILIIFLNSISFWNIVL